MNGIARRSLLLAMLAAISLAAPIARAAVPVVYHSPNDDGVGAELPTPIDANAEPVLHLWIDGGATPSSAGTACVAGSGDELCAWQVTLEAVDGIELITFAPADDATHTLTSTRLRAVGGDATLGTLGPVKLGDLSVETAEAGTLELVAGKSVGAALTLQTLAPASVVTIPEPGAGALFVAAVASLFALARRKSRHAPALVALLLLAPALARAADTDADGVDDAVDNCPYWSNAGQGDAGGFDSNTPDGIGDACQCGDVSGDGVADLRDVARIDRALAQLAPALLAPQKCPADADGVCTTASLAALREALVDPEAGLAQSCLAANPLQSCGNAQLDLGEQCDDETVANGACCSASCTLVTGGCDDGDACTTGGQCNAGVCTSVPVLDGFEPNNSVSTPVNFGTISDASSYPHATLTPSLFAEGDVDWFRFQSSDDLGVQSPRADLSGIPAGRDYDLCIYFDCDNGESADVDCTSGNAAQSGGRNGCCSRNGGNTSERVQFTVACATGLVVDDSGDVLFVVEKFSGAATCTPYSLSFGDD